MSNSRRHRPETTGKTKGRHSRDLATKRSWPRSLIVAAIVVAFAVAVSAIVSPLLDRTVHWDWMAQLAPVVFVAAAFAVRNRWV